MLSVLMPAFNEAPTIKQAISEQVDQATVKAVAALNPRRCPTYYAGFDYERHFSLPVLVSLHHDTGGPCLGLQATLVVEGGPGLPDSKALPVVATCASPGWHPRLAGRRATVFSCDRLNHGFVRLSDGSRASVSDLLARYRLIVPATPYDAAWQPVPPA
jgi:hypothetical protein